MKTHSCIFRRMGRLSLWALLAFFMVSGMKAATWTTAANGSWNSAASWTLVSGTPAASYPTTNDNVTITHAVTITSAASCLNITISGTGTLTINSGQSLVTYANFTNSGRLNAYSGIIYFLSSSSFPNPVIAQTGTQSGQLIMRFRPNGKTISVAAGSTFTAFQLICDAAGGTVNNFGSITVTSLFKMDGGVTFNNNTNGALTLKANITLGTNPGTFLATGNPNTVTYTGSGWNTVYPTTYHNLVLTHTGSTPASKTLGGNLTLNGDLSISSNVQLNCANRNVTCAGNWTNNNSTTSMTNTGGTFTFNGTDQSVSRRINAETFGNVVVACTGSLTLNSANTASYTGNFSCNDLTLQSGALDLNSTGNYTVTVRGNMSNTGGSLSGQNGYITFGGTAAQTISGNAITFPNINCNNAAGVSTSSAHSLTGTLLVGQGTFTSNTADFTLVSNTSTGITARVASLTSGAIAGSRWVIQRRILTSGSSSTTPYWGDYSSPVSGTTLSDWDNEMYLSGVGGADGTACCPTFYSVKQWNNGGSNYSNVTSLIGLGTGIGYSIWTASSLSSLNPFTMDSRGTPNTGTIPVSTPVATYYLLGNPYPSQIQWSNLGRSGINDYFWVLDETLQDYAFWDQASGSGTGKLAGTGGVINSSQAFMVESTGGGSLTFEETDKVATNVVFVRTTIPVNMVKFHFNSNNTQVGMENVIHFVDGASNVKDAQDIGYPQAPFLSKRYEVKTLTPAGQELCKNTVNLSDTKQDIPVVFKPAESGSFTLHLEGIYSLSGFTCIMLEDLETGTFTDLGANSSYDFTCADNSERRFALHFTRGKESISCLDKSNIFNTIEASSSIASKVFATDNKMELIFTNPDTQPTLLYVYNSVGQLVTSLEVAGKDRCTIDRPSMPGIYFVVLTRNGKAETHKVSVN